METLDLIKKNLNISSQRSKAIANNISNVNTVNYKRYYVDVENDLENNKALNKSNSKHISGNESNDIKLKTDNTTSTKTDGNNVEIDSEKVDQAANTIYYNALVAMANNKLSLMKIIISGGR